MSRSRLLYEGLYSYLNPYGDLFVDKKRTHLNTQFLNKRTKESVRRLLSEGQIYALKSLEFTSTKRETFYHHINQEIQSLVFSDCSFELEITFPTIDKVESILFVGCEFREETTFNNPSYNFYFVDCVLNSGLSIDSNEKSRGKKVYFEDTKIYEQAKVRNQKELSELKFQGKKTFFEKGLSLFQCDIQTFIISKIDRSGCLKIELENSTYKKNTFGTVNISESEIGDIKIANTEIQETLSLVNLKITAEFTLNSTDVKKLSISNKFVTFKSSIRNSKIQDLIFFKTNQGENSLFEITEKTSIKNFNFSNVIYGGKLKIDNAKIEEIHSSYGDQVGSYFDSISIVDSDIKNAYFNNLICDFFSIHNITGIDNFNLTESQFHDLILQSSKITSWRAEKTTVKNNLSVNSLELGKFLPLKLLLEKDTRLEKVIIKSAVNFDKCIFIGELFFVSCQLESIVLNSSVIQHLTLNESTTLNYKIIKITASFLNKFTLIPLDSVEYYISKSVINSFEVVNKSFSKTSTLSVSSTRLNYINIRHSNFYGSVYFRNCGPFTRYKLKNTKSDFHMDILTQIEDNKYASWKIDSQPTLILHYSSLGTTEFMEFSFSEYLVRFNNTKLIDCFIAGSQFPDNIEIFEVDKDKDPKPYNNQKVLVYNQLKKIAERNGDIVKSSLMHSKALASQKKVLKEEKGKVSEKLVFWLNEISNDHGESWLAALKFILIGTGYFFLVFYTAERYLSSNPVMLDKSLLWSQYLKFINPFEKITLDRHWFSNTIYFLNKIYFSYGVFQLVKAFRRHGKK